MEKHVGTLTEILSSKNVIEENIIICDVTLRDGEQTPGVSFSGQEKTEVAKKLDASGIDQIQIGISGSTPKEELEALANLEVQCDKEVMTRGTHDNWKEDARNAINLNVDVVHTFLPISPYMRAMFADLDNEGLLTRAEEIVTFIKENSDKQINVSLLDSVRSDLEFFDEIVELLVRLGVDRIRIADTVGVGTPESITHLVERVKNIKEKYNKKLIIGIHCHNDFGLALANVIAAVRSGARLVDVSINGLGERSGNPALAEVVLSLTTLYGIKVNFNNEEITRLSERLGKLSGIPLPRNMPLVGKYSFADEFDGHINAIKKNPFSFQVINPEDIGNKREIVVGKSSGLISIDYKFEQLGIKLTEDECEIMCKQVQERSEKQGGRIIEDNELLSLYNSYNKDKE